MNLYEVTQVCIEHPSNEHFRLHTHDNYEIYIFLEGDTSYIVEGKSYKLKPWDMIVIRKHEMHRAFHNSSSKYRRIVINVMPEFFTKFGCSEYEEQFTNKIFEKDNKVSAKTVHSSGIYDAVMRLAKYSDNFDKLYTPVAGGIMVELMYLINKLNNFSVAEHQDGQFHKIISYVNANYTDDIMLEKLEAMFYISKFHLCRMFKKETGLTMHQYINKKRFSLIKDIAASGMSLGEAAQMAGFGSYPTFYRAYVKEFGVSPQKGLF